MEKKGILIIALGIVLSCNQNDKQQEKIYVEIKKDHEISKKAQQRIDTNLKNTEAELFKLRDSVQKELGYFSIQYHQFNDDLNKYITSLQDKAESHSDVVYEQAALEDEVMNKEVKYEEVIKKKKAIEKRREDIEKNFNLSLTSQDTLLVKASRLINNKS